MPLSSCSARSVNCSVGHRTFDAILVSAILLEGIVVVAIIVASVYEVKAQLLRKPSQQSIGKLATLFFFALGFASRVAMFAIEYAHTADYNCDTDDLDYWPYPHLILERVSWTAQFSALTLVARTWHLAVFSSTEDKEYLEKKTAACWWMANISSWAVTLVTSTFMSDVASEHYLRGYKVVLAYIHLALGIAFLAYGRLLARILDGGGKPSSRITNFTMVVFGTMLLKAVVVSTTQLLCSDTWRLAYTVYPHLIFTVPDLTPAIYLLWIWSGSSSRWLKDLHIKEKIRDQIAKVRTAFADGTEEVRNSFRSTQRSTTRFSESRFTEGQSVFKDSRLTRDTHVESGAPGTDPPQMPRRSNGSEVSVAESEVVYDSHDDTTMDNLEMEDTTNQAGSMANPITRFGMEESKGTEPPPPNLAVLPPW